MRWCAGTLDVVVLVLVSWFAGALMRWCAGALVYWCIGAGALVWVGVGVGALAALARWYASGKGRETKKKLQVCAISLRGY